MNINNTNQKADKAKTLIKKARKVFNKYIWPLLKVAVSFIFKELLKSFFPKDES